MATPFLAVNYRSGTPKVKRYANAAASDPLPGEVVVGTGDTTTAVNHDCAGNRVLQFGGPKTWYCASSDRIYRTTDGGLSWSSVHTLSLASLISNNMKTFGIIDNGGVPYLVCFYLTTTLTQWRAASSPDGTTWTAHGPFTTASTGTGVAISSEMIHNGVMYVLRTNTGTASVPEIIFYNFAANAGGSFSVPITGILNWSGVFTVYRNTLYMFGRAGGTGFATLYDLSTGTPVVAATTSAVVLTSPGAGGRWAEGFTDPGTGDLIVIYWATAALGWKVFRFSPALAPTEITGTVLPVGLTGTTSGGNSPSNSRIRTFVDQEANPGADASVYLYYAADAVPGTGMVMYRWNGVSSLMTVEDTGGDTSDALSVNSDMDGGQYSFSNGEKTLQPSGWVSVVGGVRFTFKLFSDSGTDPVKVRAYVRRSATESRTKTPVELTNSSHGTLSGAGAGNFNQGLTADNGVTTYQVTLNLLGLGWSLVERGRVVFDVVDP